MGNLPRQPKPYEEESLASYLYKLCLENTCDIRWIIGKYSSLAEKNKFAWPTESSDIYLYNLTAMKSLLPILNQSDDFDLFNSIAEYSNLTVDELAMMTLTRFNYLKDYSLITEIVKSPNNSKYCSLCLKEQAYHRLFWQLDIVKICIKHKAYLYSECKKCETKTTIYSVIKNECTCGNLLSSTPPLYNDYDLVYLNQLKVYNSLDISLSSQYKKEDTILPKRYKRTLDIKSRCEVEQKYVNKYISSFKSKYEYLNLVHVLNLLAETEKCSLDSYMNTYLNFSSESPLLSNILLIERLTDNWPEDFFKLLWSINYKISILHKNNMDLLTFVPDRISPISCLTSFSNKTFLIIFEDIVIDYFITNYKSFYLSYFNPNANTSISFSEVNYLFGLNNNDLLDLIPLKDKSYTDYNILEFILDFFMYFINNGTVIFIKQFCSPIFEWGDEDYISLYDLCKKNKNKLIKLKDIVQTIKQHKLKIIINAFDSGLNMIILLKSEIYKYIHKF